MSQNSVRKSLFNENEGSAEPESNEAAKPAESRNPDLFDFIREHEEATEAEESKEAIVLEQ